jgi:uncharacterized protein YegP (UPF0339 family)
MRPQAQWWRNEDGEFDWRFVSRNGSDILVSSHQGYENFTDMLKAIVEVTNCPYTTNEDGTPAPIGMQVKILQDSKFAEGARKIDLVEVDAP